MIYVQLASFGIENPIQFEFAKG